MWSFVVFCVFWDSWWFVGWCEVRPFYECALSLLFVLCFFLFPSCVVHFHGFALPSTLTSNQFVFDDRVSTQFAGDGSYLFGGGSIRYWIDELACGSWWRINGAAVGMVGIDWGWMVDGTKCIVGMVETFFLNFVALFAEHLHGVSHSPVLLFQVRLWRLRINDLIVG